MDEIEKLLRKVGRQDRRRLLEAMEALRRGELEGHQVKKLSGTELYRIRIGSFRIIFSIDRKRHTVIIQSVRRRDEQTYR